MNIGGTELLVIAVLALLLFGPSLLAFWFGYVLGQRKSVERGEPVAAPPPAPPEPSGIVRSDSAPAEEADGEEGTHD
jgi:hypothetical protein